MKQRTPIRILSLLLVLLTAATLLLSCGEGSVWDSATYLEDTTLGDGATEVTVKVTADGKTVTVALFTDEATLADALLAAELCQGETGKFGLMLSHVNGIRADYDLDHGYYWSISVNGETSMVGASDIPIIGGDIYELVRRK